MSTTSYIDLQVIYGECTLICPSADHLPISHREKNNSALAPVRELIENTSRTSRTVAQLLAGSLELLAGSRSHPVSDPIRNTPDQAAKSKLCTSGDLALLSSEKSMDILPELESQSSPDISLHLKLQLEHN